LYSREENGNVFDLYIVDSPREKIPGKMCVPFVHGIELAGTRGEVVRFCSVFDDGALVNAIDEVMYRESRNRLLALECSTKILQIADGRLVASKGVWKGWVTVRGVWHKGVFEVFSSNNAWAVLFGKPLLEAFKAIHDYSEDVICLPLNESWVTLDNQ
ncbi:hypothetical protein BYT27DRAFT_7004532, partial [Phlegmacium glaucopus]